MESQGLEAAVFGGEGDKAANYSKASNRKLDVPVRFQHRPSCSVSPMSSHPPTQEQVGSNDSHLPKV